MRISISSCKWTNNLVQHILQSKPKEQLWFWYNSFHTHYIVKKKECSLIINGGRFENVISTQMMDKLNLATQKHSQQHPLTSLRKQNEISVGKRFLVEFYIRYKLQKQVYCDDVPIEAYHILQDRPWQYDTYSFTKNGKHIIL